VGSFIGLQKEGKKERKKERNERLDEHSSADKTPLCNEINYPIASLILGLMSLLIWARVLSVTHHSFEST
jgi:hypothetical protein